MSAAEDKIRLNEINELLATGIKSTTNDGQTTSFDLASLREERQAIEVRLGIRKRRPRVFGLSMGSR